MMLFNEFGDIREVFWQTALELSLNPTIVSTIEVSYMR